MLRISLNRSTIAEPIDSGVRGQEQTQVIQAGNGDGCACGNGANGCPNGYRAGSGVPLSELTTGQTGVICDCGVADEDAKLLRAMGLCVSARVKLCRAGEPCIVALGCACRDDQGNSRAAVWGACRIGLARPLAERISVVIDG